MEDVNKLLNKIDKDNLKEEMKKNNNLEDVNKYDLLDAFIWYKNKDKDLDNLYPDPDENGNLIFISKKESKEKKKSNEK